MIIRQIENRYISITNGSNVARGATQINQWANLIWWDFYHGDINIGRNGINNKSHLILYNKEKNRFQYFFILFFSCVTIHWTKLSANYRAQKIGCGFYWFIPHQWDLRGAGLSAVLYYWTVRKKAQMEYQISRYSGLLDDRIKQFPNLKTDTVNLER